ncbi:ABC-type branched-subunit amino acid transport system ATPase component/ABC-type branched-subunit amino acid transport system permease subunit [Microbacterium sp. W4I4]|uniref:branched-chain amino acid ABC transporter ATP-binding protein/permease n=1 Tax=Microbacterium sp. W4I4 TaxID=3042295 RepID=UPI00277F3E6D|nr:branched-chain amino acid ABC transporter ATP-binding protein/permease [Microbacterium sp. W4I4]MDQ0615163.1 ABC-type branched-subunit amino acid transport system ATPase component/ABC-type branched-subunit amino acid transport system permease subunit [Microbacterium sp. W4I4]
MSETTERSLHMLTWKHAVGIVAWIAVVVLFATTSNAYYAGLGASVGILALLGLGMILVTGYAGQFSLAVGAFYGIGAYGSTILTVKFGWYGLLALVVAAAIASAIGFALARPLFRLRGHFLAMATLALTEVFFLLVNNSSYTGGSTGMGGLRPLDVLGFAFTSSQSHMILNWLVVGAVLWGALMLRKGREGRALLAIRGHEAAAASAGINIASSKARVFTASAVISAIGGSLYAHQMLYINPPPFGLEIAIEVLMIAVLGGMRSPWGAIIGAIVLEFLNQAIEAILPGLLGSGAVGAGQQLVVGLLLVVILVVRPDGVVGALGALFTVLRRVIDQRHHPDAASDRVPENAEESDGSSTDMAALRRAEDADAPEREPGDVVLEATGLVKRFGGVKAVSEVSLQLHAGEVLAVIGPNGAGKSTLVNLLSGNLSPTAGRVHLGGEDTTDLKAFQVARHGLSRTFQTPCLFEGMDVEATVKVGAHLRGSVGMLRSSVPTIGALKEERQLAAETTEVLARLGLAELAHRDAKALSLGQQKQVEIARALVSHPKALLLDEPCAGLNKQEKASLMQLLRALGREGLAVLVIEHDMEFVMASADRVQVLNFGATLRVGTPEEVQSDQAVIDAYLGVSHENEPVTTTTMAVVQKKAWWKR